MVSYLQGLRIGNHHHDFHNLFFLIAGEYLP